MTDAKEFYDARRDELRQCAQRERRSVDRCSRWRGMVFIASVLMAWITWQTELPKTIGYGMAGGLFVAFLVIAGRHEQLLASANVTLQRRRLVEEQLARLARAWKQVPRITVPLRQIDEHLARDLDLFGEASVFEFVCHAETPLGQYLLRDWLLRGATPDEIRRRQDAIKRLASLPELREELQLRGRMLSLNGRGPAAFLAWAEGDRWLRSHPVATWLARGSALAMAIVVGFIVTLGWRFELGVAAGAIFLVNLALNLRFVPEIHQIFDIVASRQMDIEHYRGVFSLFSELPSDTTKLAALHARLGQNDSVPLQRLSNLHRRVNFAAARHSGLWGLPYIVLQWTFAWDFFVLQVLERWQARYGHEARPWFEALAELEALSSLACVAHDYPDWSFPKVDSTCTQLVAENLGHPLITDAARIGNDVAVGPAGRFLLVSGSNMSGKSTLLRSLGVNVALAQAGGCVCASRFESRPLVVATSMRIGDSLTDGVSFYMAELKRLKEIVDQADELHRSQDRTLLFLLDEILLGTNSAERHIAVVHVLKHLLEAGAMGAISTHDLELATSPEIQPHCQPVHFREQFHGDGDQQSMDFDYVMRPGVATTTNALKLLQLVGLGKAQQTTL